MGPLSPQLPLSPQHPLNPQHQLKPQHPLSQRTKNPWTLISLRKISLPKTCPRKKNPRNLPSQNRATPLLLPLLVARRKSVPSKRETKTRQPPNPKSPTEESAPATSETVAA